MDWIQIFVNLILTGVLLYVFQRVVDERSARRLEEFKAELKSTAFEKEIKFSKLHETRMQVLAELYRQLSHISKTLGSLKRVIKLDDPDENVQEKINSCRNSIDDFRAYVDDNRLSLPTRLYMQLYMFYVYSTGVWSDFSMAYVHIYFSQRVDEDNQFYMEDAKQRLIVASSTMDDKLVPLNNEIEREFRALLGSE